MMEVQKSFAELTGAIEDLHGIAVEGQAPDLTPDIQLLLLASLDAGLVKVKAVVALTSNSILGRYQ